MSASDKLSPEVRAAWERHEAVPCNICGSTPDDWMCEPDHCHSCLAGASEKVMSTEETRHV